MLQVMRNWPRSAPPWLLVSSCTSSISDSICWLRRRQCSPASVSVTLRVVRCSRRAPSHCSSVPTQRVTMARDMSSLSAAALKLPAWATSTNTRMAVNRSMI